MPAVVLQQRNCFMLHPTSTPHKYPTSTPQAENIFQKAGQ